MGNLGVDTAVEGGDGRYSAVLREDWAIWGPNGGYLAAVALRAAGEHVGPGVRRPASVLCHYLGVASFDRVELAVTTLRSAKRAESARVTMTQAGQPVLEALVWAVADELDGLAHDVAAAPPDVGPPDAYRPREELGAPVHPFFANIDQRPTDPDTDWENRPAGEPAFRCWARFRPQEMFPGDPWADAARLLVVVDTFQWPAAVRGHAQAELRHVAPSLDLACLFHRSAATEPWLLVEATSPIAEGGLVAGTARVWDQRGRLLASGTQQMLCRPVRSGDFPDPAPSPDQPTPATDPPAPA